MKQNGPLPQDRMLDIARQAARELTSAHAAGIVHGDLTPDDLIILSLGDQNGVVKILGLGTHYATDRDRDFAFTSPEQAAGIRGDVRSDLYSFGALMFFALTGQPPFQGTPRQLARMHAYHPCPSVSDLAPHPVSLQLDALIRKCLMKHPGGRPGSAGELAAALAAIPAAPMSIRLSERTAAGRVRAWGRQRPRPLPHPSHTAHAARPPALRPELRYSGDTLPPPTLPTLPSSAGRPTVPVGPRQGTITLPANHAPMRIPPAPLAPRITHGPISIRISDMPRSVRLSDTIPPPSLRITDKPSERRPIERRPNDTAPPPTLPSARRGRAP